MLPVNIAHGHEATVSPFSVAVKRQAIASTVYSSTGTEKYTVHSYRDRKIQFYSSTRTMY